jgi:hypothetical protein
LNGLPSYSLLPILNILMTTTSLHNIFQRRASRPYSIVETTSVILDHIGFLSTLYWSFVGRSSLHLLWPKLYNEETLRSLLKPLLTYCDMCYRGKKLCGITLEVVVEESNPHNRLKNVMYKMLHIWLKIVPT